MPNRATVITFVHSRVRLVLLERNTRAASDVIRYQSGKSLDGYSSGDEKIGKLFLPVPRTSRRTRELFFLIFSPLPKYCRRDTSRDRGQYPERTDIPSGSSIVG